MRLMTPYPNKATQTTVSTKPRAIMAAGQTRGKSLSVAAFCVTGANQVLVCIFGYRRESLAGVSCLLVDIFPVFIGPQRQSDHGVQKLC